ncbi:tyrosine-type recombinase/integrase [Microbacterium luticocti]|uniref:tyrosine-type recombinase/integrase n=1 Tax=Microbacterium luticocti TaxID=451764 RepID=UPI0004291E27|nr:tyrosine-type recombinase/integrase [Microbacterium luticocti]
MADLVREWIDRKEAAQTVTPQTIGTYRRTAATYLPEVGAIQLRHVKPAALQGAVLAMSRTKSIAAARAARKQLTSAFDLAIALDLTHVQPIRGLERFAGSPKKESALTPEGWREVCDELERWGGGFRRGGGKSDWLLLRDVLELCLKTSARVGEVIALRRRDVDVVESTVTIAATIVCIKGRGTVRQPHTKTRQARVVHLTSGALDVVARRLDAGPEDPDAPLFPNRAGSWLTPDRIAKQMRAFRKAVPELWERVGTDPAEATTHLMRRSAATHTETGGGIELAASLLGHASEKTTRASYVATRRVVDGRATELMSEYD